MIDVQLALGEFRFATSSTEYETLEKSSRWRWAQINRLNRRPGLQFQGADTREITINAVVYADSASHVKRPANLEAEGDKGEPLRLISGSQALGRDWGLWVMVELTNKHEYTLPDGTPLKQTFTIRLREYGSDNN